MSPKKSVYDRSTLDYLNKEYPASAINPYKGLPIPGPANTVLYGGVRRTSKQVFYEGSLLTLPQFINARLGHVRGLNDPIARGEAFRSLGREVHNLTLEMPSISSLSGRAGRFAFANSAVDWAWKEKTKNEFPTKEQYEQFVAEVATRGGGSSGVGAKIAEFNYSTKNLMGIYPGLGTQEEVRKFSTLLNFLPVGNIAGPGFGVVSESSMTPNGVRISQGITEEMLGGALRSSSNRWAKRDIQNAASRTSIVKMMEYSSHPALAGGAFAIRPDTYKGIYSYETKNLLFNPTGLPDTKYLEQLRHGATLTPKIINELRALNLTKDAEYQALLEQGLTSDEALRVLKKQKPKEVNLVQSLVKEGKDLRLFYGQQKAIGPGSKLSVELKKGLAASIPSVFSEASAETEIITAPLTSAERARQVVPLYQKAEIYLTDPRFVSENERLKNVHRIAVALNEENKLSGIKTRVRALNGSLYFPNKFGLTSGHVRRVAGLLHPQQEALVTALLEGYNPKGIAHPVYTHVLPSLDLDKKGDIVGGGIQDVMGLLMSGQKVQANALLGKIGKSSIGGQLRNVYQYLHTRTPIPGAETVSENMISDVANLPVNINHGAFTGHKGNPLFDPELKGNRGKTWMLPLGFEGMEFNLGPDSKRAYNQLPLVSLETSKLATMPSGTVWANQVERAKLELIKSVHRHDRSEIQIAGQNYMSALAGMSGKGKTVTEDILKTRLTGTRDTMAFLNESAETIIRQKMNLQGTNLTGFHAVTMDRAQDIFRQAFGIRSKKRIREMIMSPEGVMSPLLRHPAAPLGWTPARMVLLDKDILGEVNYGPDIKEYISAGAGSLIHGDLDQDTLNTITEFMGRNDVQKELRETWQKNQTAYQLARQHAEQKLLRVDKTTGRTVSPEFLASQEGLSQVEVAMTNIFKNRNTGIAHNAAFKVYEGAIRTGQSKSLVGMKRFDQDYAFKLANVLFSIGEESINAKRNQKGGFEVSDLMETLYLGNEGTKKSRLKALITSDLMDQFGSRASKDTVAGDILQALNVGSGTAMKNIQKMNRSGQNMQDIIDAILPHPAKIEEGGITGMMARYGIIRGSSGQAAHNQSYKDAAKSGAKKAGGYIREAVTSFTDGLKQGRGWTSLAIGGAVLAGIGLSMRKPGNITIVNNQTTGEQRNADGGYSRTNEPSVTAPRNHRSTRLMHERQYDVRVKIKEAQRQDSKKFVDLANAISGKYRQPSQANIKIRDDSNENDYGRIFRDEYQRQLRLGS